MCFSPDFYQELWCHCFPSQNMDTNRMHRQRLRCASPGNGDSKMTYRWNVRRRDELAQVGEESLPRPSGNDHRPITSKWSETPSHQTPELRKMWKVGTTKLLELGLLGTRESPSAKPTKMDVVDSLDRLKRYIVGDTTTTFASPHGMSISCGWLWYHHISGLPMTVLHF